MTPTRRTPQTGRMVCSRRARRPVDQAVLRAGPEARPQETPGRQAPCAINAAYKPGNTAIERVRDVRHLRRARRRCRRGRIQHLCAVSGHHRPWDGTRLGSHDPVARRTPRRHAIPRPPPNDTPLRRTLWSISSSPTSPHEAAGIPNGNPNLGIPITKAEPRTHQTNLL